MALRLFSCVYGSVSELESSRIVMSVRPPPKPRHVDSSSFVTLSKLSPEILEVLKSSDAMSWAEANLLPLLKPVEQSWQPQDLLPDAASEEFFEEAKEMKERAAELPDDILVCLVGNMVTEEALPTYMTITNTADGVRDETGASPTPWATWRRSWGAEEKRHGDLLNKYLYLSGRVDMRQVEKTIQYLIGSGMNSRTDNNPYCAAVYTSFQERATFISHGNTARHAGRHGDAALARICGAIAADEKRHEAGYTRLTERLFEVDPDTAMLAFADMMRKRVAMPALLMYDGRDGELFRHFAGVSQRLGVYTSRDYVDMVEYFVRRWRVVEERSRGLSAEGKRAQEYLCGLADRFRKAEETMMMMMMKKKKGDDNNNDNMVQFSWI